MLRSLVGSEMCIRDRLWRYAEGEYKMPCRFASSVNMGLCQHGPCQPARFCKKSLLLLPASSGASCCCCSRCCCCTGVHTRAAEYTSVSPAGGNVLKRASSNKSGLCYSRGKLGQSKASGEFSANRMQRSNLLSLIFGSTIFCFPKMSNLPIFTQI